MHAQPPRTLKRLLKQYGQELIDDPRRTEALLRDHCGQHTREIFVLVNAQKQRVPSELLAAPAWMPRQAIYSRLSRLLQTKLAITEDAADWAVAAWAAALDIEAMPKGDGWSWLPGKQRTPPSTGGRKSRSKKRQNSRSSVQYSKSNTSNSARKARARGARAELGWGFPILNLSRLLQSVKGRSVWANLLPWIALFTATVFLLTVVYWTSTARESGELNVGPGADGTPNNTVNSESVEASGTSTSQSVANVTPLPDLPSPAREYLSAVMPLPTWANVNENTITLNVRALPTVDSDILDFLPAGAPVEVVAFSEDGRWSQIERPRAGWVSNDFLLFQSQDASHTSIHLDVHPRRAQRYEVAVRAAPNANAKVIETLAPDEAVIVAARLDDANTWVQIADPAVGWVAVNDLVPHSP